MTVYISTRGKAAHAGFIGAMMAGLASDGGLYVPEICPLLSAEECENLKNQSYVETAWRVLAPFVGKDIDGTTLARLLQRAYKPFNHPDVAPVSVLEDGHFMLELYHGPTLAFKDVALQFLGQCFTHVLAQTGQKVTIVGATSGDTGSAAIAAFANQPNVDIVILHPKGRVSDVQRRQMTTVDAPNVHNIAIEGDFDDCQNMVKAMFADTQFRSDIGLSAINSINWARIAAQVVYYVTTAIKVRAQTGKDPAFVVPTGNFGNIYAGYVARAMGAPVGRLIAATNRNDILYRFFAAGQMKRNAVEPSLSPSMDIQVASNFERLLFDMFDQRGEAVDQTMRHFAQGGAFRLDDTLMNELRKGFGSGRTTDAQTLATINHVYETTGQLIDPHTAVGVHVAREYRQRYPDQPVVTLATAHAAKFPDAVMQATGVMPPVPPQLAGLDARAERYTTLAADLPAVQKHIRAAVGGKAGQ